MGRGLETHDGRVIIPSGSEFEDPVIVEQSDASKLKVEAEQSDASKLNVSVHGFSCGYSNIPHYSELAHNTTVEVWKPAEGYKIHLCCIIPSAPASGRMEAYNRTPPATDELVLWMDFNEKKAIPVSVTFDVEFEVDHILAVKWISDAAAPTGHITAIGHEHEG